MIYVPSIPAENEIPRMQLRHYLEQEAPHFMRTIMDVTLPSVEGRLRLPVIDTHNKSRAQELRRNPVEQFILENCHAVLGEKVLFSEFCEHFMEWITPEEKSKWSKQKIGRELPQNHPSGVYTENKKYIGNLSWEPKQPEPNARPWIVVNGRLKAK
jgi:hypothetical protein